MSRRHEMRSLQPATRWQDAFPTGNGTIGALIYGNIRNELVVLNHEALWIRTEKPSIPDISEHLGELRSMLSNRRYREAADFLTRKLEEKGCSLKQTDPYHPAFDLQIDMETQSAFSGYSRSVDFETGEVSVTWREGGTKYERNMFVSRSDDVVVMRMLSSGPSPVNCRVSLCPHGLKGSPGMGSGKDVAPRNVPISFEVSAWDHCVRILGIYEDGGGFGGLAKVIVRGGRTETGEQGIKVNDAGEVLVLVKLFAHNGIECDVAPPDQRGGWGVAFSDLQDEIEALTYDYDALLKPHRLLHGELFSRMGIDLQGGRERDLSNEELLLGAYNGDVPDALIERMFDYGRYLLISSSRPGGWPANLQGVWNGDYMPAWSADYHNDENIQMNYWQALPGNLPEVTLPYFAYCERSVTDYRTNAQRIYGCRGILAPIAQSTHGLMYRGVWLNWTAGAGWLAQLFYDYWLFTEDEEFLRKRTVPFLKEVAQFYEDFLFEDENGKLVFSPSLSPENTPAVPGSSLVTVNATMDVAIAKEVLANLCSACEVLRIEQENTAIWHRMLERLPDYEINEDGAIKEWIHPQLRDNYHHRHQSHIYPLFPGLEVTEEEKPELFSACRTAVEKRLTIGLNSQTGWSLAHMANIYARLGEGDRALECLHLLCRSCVGPNLFTYHNDWRSQGLTMYWGHGSQPPFQIDANLGISAAVLEMLVFSKPGLVKLLPALPQRWAKGSASGILCRGGITVSLQWDMSAGLVEVSLISRSDQEVTLRFPGGITRFSCSLPRDSVADSPFGRPYKVIELPAAEEVEITARIEVAPHTA